MLHLSTVETYRPEVAKYFVTIAIHIQVCKPGLFKMWTAFDDGNLSGPHLPSADVVLGQSGFAVVKREAPYRVQLDPILDNSRSRSCHKKQGELVLSKSHQFSDQGNACRHMHMSCLPSVPSPNVCP